MSAPLSRNCCAFWRVYADRTPKRLATICLTIALLPLLAFADVEKHGTVVKVDKVEKQLVIRTERGEETLLLLPETKGLANAKEGAKVIIRFTEKSGEPKVTEIIPADR
jgi:hypothetical protein